MARLNIESQAAPAVQGPTETSLQETIGLAIGGLALIALAQPGILAGAALAASWRWLQRPPAGLRVGCAIACAVLLVPLCPLLAIVWPWRSLLAPLLHLGAVDAPQVTHSVYVEALAGPLWLEAMVLSAAVVRRRLSAQVLHDNRLDQRRWRALTGRRQAILPDPQTAPSPNPLDHPAGAIRIGADAETGRPLDLELPAELATHVFVPGASGSGKTTTLMRLMSGAIANWYGIVIVDCKGGDLGEVARKLAERYEMPFQLVDPDAPKSLGYNPCSGDAASVANKLLGAFTYSPQAEIYKNIAMEAIPVVVRGLQAAKRPVTLEALYEAFGPRGMAEIAHDIPEGKDDRLRRRLLDLSGGGNGDRVGRGGYAGMQYRIGALLEGRFGDLFRAKKYLDWEKALAEPSITYIALSTLASSEDVELLGRVIAQDLKQVAGARIRAQGRGEQLVPVLTVFDEFAALNEADQLVDLLLQARQAVMPTVIATQYLPESVPLRKSCLSAGLLVVHRVEAEDAEAIAAQFGTRTASEVTHQVDYETGFSEKGSIRRVERYNVHPNELRSFKVGQVALRSVPRERYTIVRVYRDPD
ncbi:MAG TPA: hypothetical protein VKV21_14075 [Solirubrobacteraceae bacterium]|nr:hypothetical protein [Solirubrobacteraceae bacterium]